MKVSSKCRYALAAVLSMARNTKEGEYISIIAIADKLGISKIYLEQVFSLLKRADIVVSIKGAQGGYQLAKPISELTVGQIMRATEVGVFEVTADTVGEADKDIDRVLSSELWTPLDAAVAKVIDNITIEDLVKKITTEEVIMYYI